MRIQIYGPWYVHTDSRNFIVRKLKMVTDPETNEIKESWQSEHFLSTFESALQRVITEVIRDSEASDIKELLAEIHHIRSTLRALFHTDSVMPVAPKAPPKPIVRKEAINDEPSVSEFG